VSAQRGTRIRRVRRRRRAGDPGAPGQPWPADAVCIDDSFEDADTRAPPEPRQLHQTTYFGLPHAWRRSPPLSRRSARPPVGAVARGRFAQQGRRPGAEHYGLVPCDYESRGRALADEVATRLRHRGPGAGAGPTTSHDAGGRGRVVKRRTTRLVGRRPCCYSRTAWAMRSESHARAAARPHPAGATSCVRVRAVPATGAAPSSSELGGIGCADGNTQGLFGEYVDADHRVRMRRGAHLASGCG